MRRIPSTRMIQFSMRIRSDWARVCTSRPRLGMSRARGNDVCQRRRGLFQQPRQRYSMYDYGWMERRFYFGSRIPFWLIGERKNKSLLPQMGSSEFRRLSSPLPPKVYGKQQHWTGISWAFLKFTLYLLLLHKLGETRRGYRARTMVLNPDGKKCFKGSGVGKVLVIFTLYSFSTGEASFPAKELVLA